MKMPQTRVDYYPLQGGLDLVTPAISISPGCVIDSQNYEPDIAGKYRRIDGYERYDGHSSPTASSYWIVPVTITGTVAVGNTITGGSSSATGVVLGIFPGYVVCGRVSGTFTVSESIKVGGVAQGTVTSAMLVNGAAPPSDHADYLLLAANDQRQFILVVPGAGPIRGVWIFNDVVYAFRDNVGQTVGAMYKATASGWSIITFLTELRFNTATGQINVGDTVT
jgi:hypothetical protein